MGNKHEPDKPWHDTPTKPIADPQAGGGGTIVDTVEPLEWEVTLEDLAEGAENLRPGVVVRVEPADGRFKVYAGEPLVGFVPVRKSNVIRKKMGTGGGVLLGRVVEVDLSVRKVVIRIKLEGR